VCYCHVQHAAGLFALPHLHLLLFVQVSPSKAFLVGLTQEITYLLLPACGQVHVGDWRHADAASTVIYCCQATWEHRDLPLEKLPVSGSRYRLCYGFLNELPVPCGDGETPNTKGRKEK
jgi:hypothetical protein